MQVAQQVHALPGRVLGKGDKTPLSTFRLRFHEEERPRSKEEAAAWSRAVWAARLHQSNPTK